MVNLKVLLDKRRVKKDGNFNIIYRITHFRKAYTINSGISLKEEFWNSQKAVVCILHPNSKLLNLKLLKDYYILQEVILKLEDQFSIEKLKKLYYGDGSEEEPCTFKAFSEKLITQMFDSNRTGNAIVYQTAVNRFMRFCNRDDIKFSDIDYSLLEKFSHSLTIQGLKTNSISNYFRSLRAIYNKAIKEKLVERSNYPFYDIKIKSETTSKRAISKKDIFKLRDIEVVEGSALWKALNYFLLSYYLIGISFTDLAYLKQKNIIDGRIVYRRRKTHKIYSIRLFPQAQAIFQKFHSHNSDYLLQVLPLGSPEDTIQAKKIISQWIKTTNKHLKVLGNKANLKGNLTTYVARHTFATTAKKMGYSNELIAEALGHNYGNKVTNIYLDSFDMKEVDKMHLKVISID